VKADFASASIVGNCVVFNIGGNKCRLVTRILNPSQKVLVLKVMTHGEYDEDKWKEERGCYEPPPRKPTAKRPKPGTIGPPKRKRRQKMATKTQFGLEA